MERFGLITRNETDTVTLRGVRMTARLAGLGMQVRVEQTFINREKTPIEAIYTFPLPDGAAACGFEIVTGEKVIVGEIEEREEAEKQYDEAMREGHGAFMAEAHRPDVFATRIGNLAAGQAVTVKLDYVAPLAAVDRTVRVTLPTTIAPRYASSAGMDVVDAAIDGDALNPPHVLSVPYGVTVSIDVAMGAKVSAVGSPTHGVRVQSVDDAGGVTHRVTFAHGTVAMDRDVVVEIELAREAEPAALVERAAIDGGDETFVAVTFVPTFDDAPAADAAAAEVVFLVDCSGSMGGDSIEQAKTALALCLKSLSVGDRFNIVRFGSTFELMEKEPVVYSQRSLDRALAYVARIDATLGGTEIYEPLEAVLQTKTRGRARDVIVLTDGQVSNEPAVVALARKHRGSSRIFSFGIGAASSSYLVNGLARESGGAAEFVSAGERIEEKVLRTFSRIASPMVTDVAVNWGNADVQQSPAEVLALFDGDAVTVVGRALREVKEVTLSCIAAGKKRQWNVAVPPAHEARPAAVALRSAGVVGLLWARGRVREMEERMKSVGNAEEAALRADVVKVSKAFRLLSSATSFVGVEFRSEADRVQNAVLRRVPVAIPVGWGQAAEAACAAPAQAPMAMPPAAPGGAITRGLRKVIGSFGKNAGRKARTSPASAQKSADLEGMVCGGMPDNMLAEFLRKSERASAAAAESQRDLHLEMLLMEQSADGWFERSLILDHPTVEISGQQIDLENWRQDLDAQGVRDTHAVDTAITLKLLRTCFADRETLWKRAFAKGIKWLTAASAAAATWVKS